MPHPHPRRSRFDEFAERATRVVSGSPFFAAVVVLILAWVPTLFLMESESSLWLITIVSAIVTLLLVALLQNSQTRNEEAVNLKLNAIARAVADLMREHTGEDQDLSDNIDRLTESLGIEDRTTTNRPSNEEKASARSS